MTQKCLKIFAPVDRLEEVVPLINAGADEFYCGLLIDGKNLSSIRKQKSLKSSLEASNLSDLKSLQKVASIIKKHKKKIYIAFNLMGLDSSKKQLIKDNLEKIKSCGVNGIILSDIRLIEKCKNLDLEIIASSFFETKNRETIRLLKEKGVNRIILDRQITLEDLKEVNAFPELDFETFIMSSACRSLASYCGTSFFAEKSFWQGRLKHLCTGHFAVVKSQTQKCLSKEDLKVISQRLRMPGIGLMGSCGACALFNFNQHQIHSIKVVGRGFSLDRKINSIRLIKEGKDLLKKNISEEEFHKNMKRLFKKVFGQKCNSQHCYYPHFFK